MERWDETPRRGGGGEDGRLARSEVATAVAVEKWIILCVNKKRNFVDGDTLADVTHSLLGRVIAMIAGHARRSWILARGLHALGDLLEAILPHLNPLRHVAHRGVLCE